MSEPGAAPSVMCCEAVAAAAIERLLARFGLASCQVVSGATIPGSYWGAPEAGLIGKTLFWRPDTPLHSLLHELAHFVCMEPARRACLDTDAGGDDQEECAVCYLEVLLADRLAPFDGGRCLRDMDAWGYSFREGSARAWFAGDGREAREWLMRRSLLAEDGTPSWRLRRGERV
ncbi:MAG TPA: hypothetical protein VIV64_03780 [Gammaproteobacteria bacterium]